MPRSTDTLTPAALSALAAADCFAEGPPRCVVLASVKVAVLRMRRAA
jgi:hypothetical protein